MHWIPNRRKLQYQSCVCLCACMSMRECVMQSIWLGLYCTYAFHLTIEPTPVVTDGYREWDPPTSQTCSNRGVFVWFLHAILLEIPSAFFIIFFSPSRIASYGCSDVFYHFRFSLARLMNERENVRMRWDGVFRFINVQRIGLFYSYPYAGYSISSYLPYTQVNEGHCVRVPWLSECGRALALNNFDGGSLGTFNCMPPPPANRVLLDTWVWTLVTPRH